MAARDQIIVVGGGVVGSLAALLLAQRGIPVTLVDAAADPSADERGAILHPASLDLVAECGVTAFLLEHGALCPTVQYRARANGRIVEFDLAGLGCDARHPYRIVSKRAALVRFLHDALRETPGARILLSSCPVRLRQNDFHVELAVQLPKGTATLIGTYLIGAEDEISAVRALLGAPLDRLAPPLRFVTSAIDFDFRAALGALSHITYFADTTTWSLLVQRRGAWELTFPVPADVPDMDAASLSAIRARLAALVRDSSRAVVVSRRIEPAGRSVARLYGRGRVFLAGDAAHQLDPTDDVSLNCGLRDAVDLTSRLAEVWHGLSAPRVLDAYEEQRRPAAMAALKATLEHNKFLIAPRDGLRQRLAGAWRRLAGDSAPAHAALLRKSAAAALRPPREIR